MLSQLENPDATSCAPLPRTLAGTFVLNAAPAAELPDDLLALCDVLVVNEQELSVVAGVDAVSG